MVKRISSETGPQDVDDYIARAPGNVQGKLREIRAAIREAAPGASETTSYFQIPGYFYPGYDYNGMFVWFGLRKSRLSLLLRPPTIEMHRRELEGYSTTKAAVHLPVEGEIPVALVKKLVMTSLGIMKAGPKKDPAKSQGFIAARPEEKRMPRAHRRLLLAHLDRSVHNV